ncbi:MAG: 50S ribosomal protein L9 [Candidatus Omnitrophica bacterium]|nr:50S ribosomal protein L9 [Candidatus Omnitrophota bacterium]
MEVILIQDVDKLGKEGDIVKVKDGYGRNYLIPRKLAMTSNSRALKLVEAKKKKRQIEEEKRKRECEELSKKISSLSCTITVEAGVEDKIFGTVTTEMIKNAFRQDKIEVDKKQILIEEPINKLGVYQVKIKLHPEVIASARIWVVKK